MEQVAGMNPGFPIGITLAPLIITRCNAAPTPSRIAGVLVWNWPQLDNWGFGQELPSVGYLGFWSGTGLSWIARVLVWNWPQQWFHEQSTVQQNKTAGQGSVVTAHLT